MQASGSSLIYEAALDREIARKNKAIAIQEKKTVR